MTIQNVLAFVADGLTPIILSMAFWAIFASYKKHSKATAKWQLALLMSLLLWIYIVKFADDTLRLWTIFSLDYSTHTAFALAVVSFYGLMFGKYQIATILSFLAYMIIMIYLKYHTLADIISTIIFLSPVMYLMIRYVQTKLNTPSQRAL